MSNKDNQYHSVQAMVFDVKFSSESQAFKFQYQFNDLVKSKLLSITEKVFNDLIPPHQVIRVKSLNIDLETVPLDKFNYDLPDIFEKRLREALRALLFRLDRSAYSVIDDASATSPIVGLSELLSFFLKTGTLPWWAKNTWQTYLSQNKHIKDQTLKISNIFEIVFEKNPKLLVLFIERSKNAPNVLHRLADQVPDQNLIKIIKLVSEEKSIIIQRIVNDFAKISTPKFLSFSQSQVRVLVWQTIFLNWEQSNESILVKSTLDKILGFSLQQTPVVEQYILQIHLSKHTFQTSLPGLLEQVATNFSIDRIQKEIYSSDEKIKQMLRELVSIDEAKWLITYVKNIQSVLKQVSKQQIWEKFLDFLWVNKRKKLDIEAISTYLLPKLTHNWEQAAKQLQVSIDENLLIFKKTEQKIVIEEVNNTPEKIKKLLTQILSTQQASWLWTYGDSLATVLKTSSSNIWQLLFDQLWENRNKTFSRQEFIKVSLPKIWRKTVKQISVSSKVVALQDHKMWEIPPVEALSQFVQKVEGFAEVSETYWKQTLSIDSSSSKNTTKEPTIIDEASSESSYDIEELKKGQMSQALQEGKIKDFIEQILPEEAPWIIQYSETLVQVFSLAEKVIWETIIDYLWENRQSSFTRANFLIGSFSKIIELTTKPRGRGQAPGTSSNSSSSASGGAGGGSGGSGGSDGVASQAAELWTYKKNKLSEILKYYPEFETIREEVLLTSYHKDVTQRRRELLAQPISIELQKIIENLLTKGLLPAPAQLQRVLATNAQSPIASMEETVTNLLDATLNNSGSFTHNINQLFEPLVLFRLIEQTSFSFVQLLAKQMEVVIPNLVIPSVIDTFLQKAQTYFSDNVNDVSTQKIIEKLQELFEDSKKIVAQKNASKDQSDTKTSEQRKTEDSEEQSSSDTSSSDTSSSGTSSSGTSSSGTSSSGTSSSGTEEKQDLSGVEKDHVHSKSESSQEALESAEIASFADKIQLSTEEITKDIDVLVYYLQYFLRHKQLSASTSESNIREWLITFRSNFSNEFQSFLLALSSVDIDLLAPIVPEVTTWVEDAWRNTAIQDQDIDKSAKESSDAQEREAFERIKKEIFKSVEEQKQHLTDQPIYIDNAGLVILHPYLMRLFEMLGFTETQEVSSTRKKKKKKVVFKSEADQERAAYVLQYLATKNENAAEHEMVLNKILCGIEITTPFIGGKIELTDEEKETCDDLLNAVVQNWAILKDSPADMLRGSFFMREGKLELKANDWLLKVEETGVDILLQHLPWSIKMVKLPWMDKIMNVEWL